LRDYDRIVPKVDVERTDYGYAFTAIRLVRRQQYVRTSQYFMPAMQLRSTLQQALERPEGPPPTMDGHIWVPVDDTHTWVYNFTYSYFPNTPLSREQSLELEERQGRGPGEVTETYRLRRDRSNNYMIDRALQRNGSFTGIEGVNTQDYALQENMETIVDRTKEHLSTIDQPIIVARQLLLEAADDVEAGRIPRGAAVGSCRGVRAADDMLALDVDWRNALEPRMQALY
jgi:phthalate 4,5-dioxygenase